MIQKNISAGVEELCASQMVGMSGNWRVAKFYGSCGMQNLRFVIQSVYEVLLSPSSVLCWPKMESPSCYVCRGRGALEHILLVVKHLGKVVSVGDMT